MSNDSSYTIRITGEANRIDQMLDYLVKKMNRWEAWEKKHKKITGPAHLKAMKKSMKELGLTYTGEFVSWGFTVEKRVKRTKTDTVTLYTWANENSSNTPVSGPEGELHALHEKFPDLTIKVKYKDDYSKGGCAPPNFEKDFGGNY
jgi:hypothetical protein